MLSSPLPTLHQTPSFSPLTGPKPTIGSPIIGWITSYNKSTFLSPSNAYYTHPTITDAPRSLLMAFLVHPFPSVKGFLKVTLLPRSFSIYPSNLYLMLFGHLGYGSEHMQTIHMP